MALALYGFISRKQKIEQAGISYEFSIIRDKITLGLSTLPILKNQLKPIDNDINEIDSLEWMDEETEKYKKYLSKLDPNDAKEQDHYKILGLTKLRCEATSAQIRAAYRQKVLKYHPDKGNACEGLRSETVFACIQKAYEQLGISEDKRRAYDSIDPTFDESIPDINEIKSGINNFFKILGPVFERNSRFSVNQPVPLLGDETSNRLHVENFYDFWFNWKSWREFSYLDAEDKQKGEDRWERREIEKQNKAEREKRRKKDLKRISTLVELTYSLDPRIIKFKEEDKNKKQLLKDKKRKEKELKEQLELEEKRQKEKDLEEEMLRKNEEEKKALQAKQQKKKELSLQRKRLRDLSSNTNYWLDSSFVVAEHSDRVFAISEQIERLCLCAEVNELISLCERLNNISIYDEALRILRECASPNESSNNENSKNGVQDIKNNSSTTCTASNAWTTTELQLLVKAVNLFPPGTQERWKQVSVYINEHSGEGINKRSEKDVIKQVKQLKSGQLPPSITTNNNNVSVSSTTNVQINQNLSEIPKQQQLIIEDNKNDKNNNEDEWNIEQQRQFEKALKEIPLKDVERWEKIASLVDGKTKKQCIKRYKRLAEMVKNVKNNNEVK